MMPLIDEDALRYLRGSADDLRRAADDAETAAETVDQLLRAITGMSKALVAAIQPVANDGLEIAAVWHDAEANRCEELRAKIANEAIGAYSIHIRENCEARAAAMGDRRDWHTAAATALRTLKVQDRLPGT